jgi:hypothetical protein
MGRQQVKKPEYGPPLLSSETLRHACLIEQLWKLQLEHLNQSLTDPFRRRGEFAKPEAFKV